MRGGGGGGWRLPNLGCLNKDIDISRGVVLCTRELCHRSLSS